MVSDSNQAVRPQSAGVSDRGQPAANPHRADVPLAFLIGSSQAFASSLDYATTLSNVAHLVVPQLADWCVIDIVEDDGSIDRLAAAHADPKREQWAREMTKRYPPDAARNSSATYEAREAQLVPV